MKSSFYHMIPDILYRYLSLDVVAQWCVIDFLPSNLQGPIRLLEYSFLETLRIHGTSKFNQTSGFGDTQFTTVASSTDKFRNKKTQREICKMRTEEEGNHSKWSQSRLVNCYYVFCPCVVRMYLVSRYHRVYRYPHSYLHTRIKSIQCFKLNILMRLSEVE